MGNEEKLYTPEEAARAILRKAHEMLKEKSLSKANTSHEVEIGEEPRNDDAECPEYLAQADIEGDGERKPKKAKGDGGYSEELEHEEGMNESEETEHDLQEQEDDEQDADIIEADEEEDTAETKNKKKVINAAASNSKEEGSKEEGSEEEGSKEEGSEEEGSEEKEYWKKSETDVLVKAASDSNPKPPQPIPHESVANKEAIKAKKAAKGKKKKSFKPRKKAPYKKRSRSSTNYATYAKGEGRIKGISKLAKFLEYRENKLEKVEVRGYGGATTQSKRQAYMKRPPTDFKGTQGSKQMAAGFKQSGRLMSPKVKQKISAGISNIGSKVSGFFRKNNQMNKQAYRMKDKTPSRLSASAKPLASKQHHGMGTKAPPMNKGKGSLKSSTYTREQERKDKTVKKLKKNRKLEKQLGIQPQAGQQQQMAPMLPGPTQPKGGRGAGF